MYLNREEAFNSKIIRLELLAEISFQCEKVLIKIQSVSQS